MFEGHYGQIGAGYLFDSDFQEAYLEKGLDCYIDFLDEVPSASQIKKDARALYGALLSTCHIGVGRRILMENRSKQDGNRSWCQLVQKYETDGNRNARKDYEENHDYLAGHTQQEPDHPSTFMRRDVKY